MIEKMDYFTVKCDNCGKLYADEHNGFSAWNDETWAEEYASNDDWIKEGYEHYCPNCYRFDDEDNLIILERNNLKS